MGKTLFRALLLIGLGVAGGFVHAQYRGVRLKLPEQPPQAARAAGSGTEQPSATRPAESPTKPVEPGDKPPAPAPTKDPVDSQPAAPPAAPAPATAPPPAPVAPAENDWFISLAQAKEYFDKKSRGEWDGYFLDARPYNDYMEGHIPGAMALDKSKMLQPKVRNYLKGMPVIIYCHGENCTDSEAVAKRLIALNYQIGPIFIIKEGFPAWQKAGFPVDKGHEVGFE